MGKKVAKSTKKFAASGQLKKVIETRRKHQQIRKRNQSRRGAGKNGKQQQPRAEDSDMTEGEEEQDLEDEQDVPSSKVAKITKGMTVDDFLRGDFMEGSDDEDNGGDNAEDEDNLEDDEDAADDASFASVDDLDDEGEAHMLELVQLAEKDPEFYKYLQENDRELLEFDSSKKQDEMDVSGDEDGEDGIEEDDDVLPTLTLAILKKWQKALLEQRSLRALRRMLIAFRSAAHMNEDNQVLAWSIDSSAVYNKLITTALKYTPVVLEHHVPYKKLSNGKFKPPTQTQKFKTLQKLILSYFLNVVHVTSQLTDGEMLHLAISESAKLIPYVTSSRKAVKLYLKKCLELWSSSEDNVRLAAILAIRRLASSSDESIMDSILRGIYLTVIRSSKSTTPHTLPSINLMKNSASDVFCIDHSIAYQHAFGFIRQLAIHLRNSMKLRTKDAYKEVYNWQFAHCVDFWSIVLAKTCDIRLLTESGGKESEMRPLIYPLVQISLGAIKLISNARSHPFHLHIIRSLLHLINHTHIYIPLSPYLMPIISYALTPSSRPKSSTLRPLDLDVHIRIPQQYMKTRIYFEGIMEEASYLLAEWLASESIQGSIGFPEIVIPITVLLRKSLKDAKSSHASVKDQNGAKTILERIEESARWVEEKRKTVTFAPGKMDRVAEWETYQKSKVADSPLAKYVKIQRKIREKRQKLSEKAREGEEEMLEE
ncbi:hypothetical protein AX17_003035 [Amanita inopinata Kibby_2008]|nr:hypothetical protein AX17_003035 [Amanita inopinata Kibby_2008]